MMSLARDVLGFRAVLTRRLGLSFDDARVRELGDLLRRRTKALEMAPETYVAKLGEATGFSATELETLANELTVGETYFFRDADQLRTFIDVAVPERLRYGARLRILSAGCSSGEEPYTLAILLREHHQIDASILAIDLSPAAIAKARRRRYSQWSLRDVPPDVVANWFHRDKSEFVLREDIGRNVQFEQQNLADLSRGLFAPSTFDIVFCRNVLMYFAPEVARAIVQGFALALRPGGFLFLGHADSLRGISNDFHLRHEQNAFFYERHDVVGTAAPLLPPEIKAPRPAVSESSWIDVIDGATQRLRALGETYEVAATTATPPDLGPALALVEQERFADALGLLERLPPDGRRDVSVMLLEALLLTHTGDLANGERLCTDVLRADEMNAEAHYIFALCREAVGDIAGAKEHDEVASHLDPTFAMPYLHIGLLSQRNGSLGIARTAFRRAVDLLETEAPTRISLYGGGFGRDALIALCQSHLAAEAR